MEGTGMVARNGDACLCGCVVVCVVVVCGRKRQWAGWLEDMMGAGHLPHPTKGHGGRGGHGDQLLGVPSVLTDSKHGATWRDWSSSADCE